MEEKMERENNINLRNYLWYYFILIYFDFVSTI